MRIRWAGTCLPNSCPETGCITLFIKNSLPQQRVSFRDRYPAAGLQATISHTASNRRIIVNDEQRRTWQHSAGEPDYTRDNPQNSRLLVWEWNRDLLTVNKWILTVDTMFWALQSSTFLHKHNNIILPSLLRSPKWSLYGMYSYHFKCTLFPYKCYINYLTLPSWANNLNSRHEYTNH
jgi:hypothetical protein